MSFGSECWTLPVPYEVGIKNVSNVLPLAQLALFYDRAASKQFHVFRSGNLLSGVLSRLTGRKVKVDETDESMELRYTKQDFPVLARLDYKSGDSNYVLYTKRFEAFGTAWATDL